MIAINPSIEISTSVVDITPIIETHLGCGPAEKVSPRKPGSLEANVLLMRNTGESRTVAIVSVDALYAGPKLREYLAARLPQNISPTDLLLAASHTHFAPMLDDTKPKLGGVSEEHLARVVELIAKGILEASASFERSLVRSSAYHSSGIRSRRKVLLTDFRRPIQAHFLPALVSKRHRTATILEFSKKGQNSQALIWICPIHPVGWPDASEMSADYIGEIRSYWRGLQTSAPNAAFVFFQGASGDLRPDSMGWRDWKSARKAVLNLLVGRVFKRMSAQEYSRWILRVRRGFDLGLRRLSRLPFRETRVSPRRLECDLGEFLGTSEILSRRFSAMSIEIGDHNLIGLSGELTSKLGQILKSDCEAGGFGNTIVPFGCIDDSFGYLTTKQESLQGGYEVTGFQDPFSLPNFLTGELESRVLSLVRSFGAKF